MFLYSFLIDSAVMPYMYTGTKSLKNYVLVILLAHNFLFMKMSSFWYLFLNLASYTSSNGGSICMWYGGKLQTLILCPFIPFYVWHKVKIKEISFMPIQKQ